MLVMEVSGVNARYCLLLLLFFVLFVCLFVFCFGFFGFFVCLFFSFLLTVMKLFLGRITCVI